MSQVSVTVENVLNETNVTVENEVVSVLVTVSPEEAARAFALQAEAAAAAADVSEFNAAASAAAALASENAAELAEDNAAASASTATAQAGIATTQAGIATTQAGIATTQASAALASQNAAAASASAALGSQNAAAASASTATAQANIATTQAGNALASANAAAASAAAAAQVGTSTLLTGLSIGPNQAITATDSILTAFGEVQAQINARAVISGTPAAGQVAFWGSASALAGNANFAWDNAGQNLNVNGVVRWGQNAISGNNRGALSWDTDLVFINAVQNLSFRTGGADRIRISVSGNVGINTTTDAGFRLDVNGTARVTNALQLDGGGGVAAFIGNSRALRTGVASGSSVFCDFGDAIFRRGDGASTEARIGINVTPTATLHVNGTTLLNGLQTFQGTTASDTAPLGSELTTTGTGAGWTGSGFATGYAHTAGLTDALTTSLAAVSGTYYQIAYTITGRTAGSITINYGGTSTAGITATGATGPLASSTASLTIVPTSDFDGTLVLSIRTIGTSSATTTFTTSAGTSRMAIRSTTTSNTLIGLTSGRRITTGVSNVFIEGGRETTTGFENTAIGTGALQSNTVGNLNTALGSQVMLQNQSGIRNVALGAYASFANVTGSNNVAVGMEALNLSTSSGNTAVGNGALAQLNVVGASNNVALGNFAGRFTSLATNNTAGSNSIFIGVQAVPNDNSQSNQIVIGHTAVGLGSNTTVIGNSSTTFGRWFGNLLIGTSTNAGFGLDVNGTARVSGALTTNLTAGRVPFVGTGGVLSDSAGLTYTASTNTDLFITGITGQAQLTLRDSTLARSLSITTNSSASFITTGASLTIRVQEAGNFELMTTNSNTRRLVVLNNGNVLINTNTNIASSLLTVESTTQGVLFPRMTSTQRNAIASPATGLVVYNTTDNRLSVYNGTAWVNIATL